MNPRIEIIQKTIDRLSARTYLEIGVARADTFLAIEAPRKIGVEPRPPDKRLAAVANDTTIRNFQLPSDDFFASHADLFTGDPIDVAFVDGLHSWQQAARDVENCLRYLSPNGVIIMHDCNPTNEIMTTPYDQLEAVRMAGRWHGTSWTGDVWKAVALLRSTRDDIRIFVLDTDWGLGVVTRGTPDTRLDFSPAEVANLCYADLDTDRERILNLTDPARFDEFLLRLPAAVPAAC